MINNRPGAVMQRPATANPRGDLKTPINENKKPSNPGSAAIKMPINGSNTATSTAIIAKTKPATPNPLPRRGAGITTVVCATGRGFGTLG